MPPGSAILSTTYCKPYVLRPIRLCAAGCFPSPVEFQTLDAHRMSREAVGPNWCELCFLPAGVSMHARLARDVKRREPMKNTGRIGWAL